ncbi:MAG: Na+/H+ antiporter subunit C [Desulfobacteraceae bacterium]|nr:Na+/H+ antiporter subunit C [Desulfobacteraceae bacterium]MDD3992395.1 Na+/H+ antiporter subunit C [Desulfobacteraceae bacterium]
MQSLLPLLVGAMVAASVYLMLCRDLIRFIFGLVLASNAVNLLILAAGRADVLSPPLIARGQSVPGQAMANALPQALILTAIVIGFALLAFVFVLFYRAYQELGTVDSEAMRTAESDPDDASAEVDG